MLLFVLVDIEGHQSVELLLGPIHIQQVVHVLIRICVLAMLQGYVVSPHAPYLLNLDLLPL